MKVLAAAYSVAPSQTPASQSGGAPSVACGAILDLGLSSLLSCAACGRCQRNWAAVLPLRAAGSGLLGWGRSRRSLPPSTPQKSPTAAHHEPEIQRPLCRPARAAFGRTSRAKQRHVCTSPIQLNNAENLRYMNADFVFKTKYIVSQLCRTQGVQK